MTPRMALVVALLAAVALPSCATASPAECGKASWYALKGRTASGKLNNPNALTAAHRKLPFGSEVRVHNLANGRSVVVRIEDRGPFIRGRIIDVSKRAAKELGFLNSGVTRVAVTKASDTSTVRPLCR